MGVVIGAVALVTSLAVPAAAPKGFVSFRPLKLEELYAKRMRFLRGEPIISVGLMEAQDTVVVRAPGPSRLMFEASGRDRTVYGKASSRFILKVKNARPAEIRYWVTVSDHAYTDVLAAESSRKLWQSSGLSARMFDSGTIVALRGNVLDTRRRQVAVGGFSTREEAVALGEEYFEDRGLRTTIREELVKLPAGTIVIHDRRMRRLHEAKDVVYFGTTAGGQLTVENVEHSRGYKKHGRQTRGFWGHIYVAVDRYGKLSVLNSVGAERLLAGLVPAEIFAKAPARGAQGAGRHSARRGLQQVGPSPLRRAVPPMQRAALPGLRGVRARAFIHDKSGEDDPRPSCGSTSRVQEEPVGSSGFGLFEHVRRFHGGQRNRLGYAAFGVVAGSARRQS